MPLDSTAPRLLSDAEFGISAAPKLLSDAEFNPPPTPAFNTEYGPTPTMPAPERPQTLPEAAISAVGQGVVSGAGAMVGGAGDIAKAGDVPWSQAVLHAFDLVDQGKGRDAYQKLTEAQRQQVGAYRGGSPEDKAAQRAALQQTIDDYAKPSLLQRGGASMETAAPELFPVEAAQEGHITGAARMVGGVGPIIAGGALGGPGGVLAGAAAIGAQAFHGARADAKAHDASDEEADAAAGRSAIGQMAAMSIPIGKVIPLIPVPLREGFLKTVAKAGVGLAKSGVELSAGNTLGTMAQNYVASHTYDPGRPVFQETGDASIDGFLAGLVVHGAGAVAGAARTARPSVADIGAAGDVDSAIEAAARVAQTPAGAGEAETAATTGWGQLFGATPAENGPGASEAPVLIRRLDLGMTPEQERQFAVESNLPSGQRLSGTEQAAIDARTLTPDLLAQYNPMLTGGPTAAGNRDFVRAWVGTLPQAERNAVMGPDGAISADGARRLSGAMLALGYGDKGTLGRSLESTYDNARTLTGALVDAAPAWAQLQADIGARRVPPEMNVAPQLTRAVDLVRQAREKGQTVADVLAQSDAFDPVDPVTAAFVRAFFNPLLTRAASRPVVAEVLRRYAVEAAKTSTDAGLFGEAQPQITPADIIAAVTRVARGEPPAVPEPGASALAAMNVPQSVGAAASRNGTPAAQLAMSARDAASSRYQGEVERLAAPPVANDKNVYIPGTQQSLAEITGDPVVAMEHQYNRQQPAASQFHVAREDANADQLAAYYADTAGSKQTVDRLEDDRSANAARNIQRVFGDRDAARPPADPTPTLELLRDIRTDPRQAERSSVAKVVTDLVRRFYDNGDPQTGKLKTDPLALYGIGEHINDLLAGVGDTETSSAARVLKRELMAIKTSLYNDIEGAAPGFAQYREQYQRESQAIAALKYLQDQRVPLLGANQRITPAKWVTFMRNTVKGRADPMDPASALSEDQMDRLWNITDQLKRQTLENKGKPQGSWTSLMHEIGIRSIGRLAGHIASAVTMPVVGNVAVEILNAKMRERDVIKEMNRHLHPDMGQGPLLLQ